MCGKGTLGQGLLQEGGNRPREGKPTAVGRVAQEK